MNIADDRLFCYQTKKIMPAFRRLRLILGDQLNADHSWYNEQDEHTLYVLMECRSETDYVRHHVQKVIGFFLAMRHFADYLKGEGHQVRYLRLDDAHNRQSIVENLDWLLSEYQVARFEYQLPDEYRLDEALRTFSAGLEIDACAVDSEHFLTSRERVADHFKGKKTYLLESFYRAMRKEYNILMEEDGETPLSGRWNYDEENRKSLPEGQSLPEHLHFDRNVEDLLQMLEEAEVSTFGRIDPQHFTWPVTREECRQLLDHFTRQALPLFGAYQDAMTDRDYLLFHSKLSFAMNSKMLHPLEVVRACIDAWRTNDGIDLAQIEGFVRQIIGWREYMRGIYWAKMPNYAEMNFFGHTAKLPDFYWTGETKMKCLQHAINQSLDHAYAHHIQRLMVTGNFALLLGVHPDEVDEWYLGIYMDAVQWVEITNTRGMSQFADGGIVGSKPYVSSANYIHKMSNYCSQCPYDHKDKTGEKACPFNSLYWDFFDRHTDKLSKNPRIGMMYSTWRRMKDDKKEALLRRAAYVKAQIESF